MAKQTTTDQLDDFFEDWIERMERLRREPGDEVFLDLMARMEHLRMERGVGPTIAI